MKPTLDQILSAVSEAYKVSVEDIQSPTRKRRVSDARKMYYYIAISNNYSLNAIGAKVQRNHSTVLLGANAILGTISVYADARAIYQQILTDLSQMQ